MFNSFYKIASTLYTYSLSSFISRHIYGHPACHMLFLEIQGGRKKSNDGKHIRKKSK